MKRVVLFYPEIIKGWQARPRVGIPLSLLSLVAPARKAGYDVRLIDQRVEPRWEAELLDALKQGPLCVGISSMTGPQLRHALAASALVKRHSSAPVVWGGPHPSLMPEQTVGHELVDVVVEGEGEETLPELLQALEGTRPMGTVKGIWYKDGGRPVKTAPRDFTDLNTQPPLDYSAIDLSKHSRNIFNIDNYEFVTSRGCPHRCAFCYNVAFHKRRWRAMDPDLAVARIVDFVRTYGVKGLYINDSNFFFDVARAKRILEGIAAANLDVIISKLNFDFSTLQQLDDGVFELLQKAGCRWLPIAVETASSRVQQLIRKPIDIPQMLDINRHLARFDMAPHYAFVMGFPTETEDDLAESIRTATQLLKDNPKAGTVFNIFTPYPGTELFELALKMGLRMPERVEDWFPFNYRNLVQGGPWLSDTVRRLITTLDFSLNMLGESEFLKPYRETSALTSYICRVYAPLARMRIKHLWHQFPIEVQLAKALGLYAKQE